MLAVAESRKEKFCVVYTSVSNGGTYSSCSGLAGPGIPLIRDLKLTSRALLLFNQNFHEYNQAFSVHPKSCFVVIVKRVSRISDNPTG
jgi:hypothetical protein